MPNFPPCPYPRWVIGILLLNIGRVVLVLNETNADVCTSRYLDTLLYKVELNVHWNYTGLYTNTTIDMRRLSDAISRVLNALHTYELSDVSTGEFIDTLSLSHSLLAGETVNCCQHVEDLKAIGNSRYRNTYFPPCSHRVRQWCFTSLPVHVWGRSMELFHQSLQIGPSIFYSPPMHGKGTWWLTFHCFQTSEWIVLAMNENSLWWLVHL